ncbi:MAG TPA: zf-HC2 domain-containing protein, partial [Anaerolineales bacterium]|nr:zf-HC2 domain-containing protein [Anaerolineales bacterium]
MNQISHKQAIQWINRRLDGLLTEKQVLLLDEHLRTCDSCAAYDAEIDRLPARLQNEFHARWDEKPGPSQKVMQHVTTKARNIPMKNRISAGVKLFAGAGTLILLAFVINFFVSGLRDTFTTATGTEIVNVLPRAEDRLLAFASIQNGNSDIYTMHADGSGLTNLTSDTAFDGNPLWSPDGKQIAFVSDRSGSPQIYLMDADGSNVIQLTNGEGNSGFDTNNSSSWSPDGTKLIFANKTPGEQGWKLYILDIHEKTSTALTKEPGAYLRPYWSPDGEHIAFVYYESEATSQARHLFVVDKSGNDLTELTESLRIDETYTFLWLNYYWSQDGTSIFFTTERTGSRETTVYEAGLDGSLSIIASVTSGFVDWWDGTTLQQEGNSGTLTWLHSNGSQATLDLCQSGEAAVAAYKRSSHGNLVFGANCSLAGWMLYWANPEGTITNKLLNSPISSTLFSMTWSPDDHFLAFVAMNLDPSNVTQTLYVLDVEQARKDPSIQPLKMESGSDPAWQPVLDNKVAEEEPTPVATHPSPSQADNRLLAFTSIGEDGNLDIYTMRPDGSALTNLTNNPAYDANPFWSPDGKHIAFESDRAGLQHIYLISADSSDVTRLTDGEARYEIGATYGMNSTPWSPDGTKLIVSLWPPGETTRTLYVMDADGGNKTPLVSQPSNYFSFPSWSPDGQRITFIADDPTNPAATHLHIVNADGSQPVDVGQFLPENESLWAHNSYSWSQNGQSIFFIAYRYSDAGQNEWIVYEFSLPGNQLTEHARSS